MHLIFRYNYSVQEVWGPFLDEEIALEFLKALLLERPERDGREFAVKEIDHLEGSVIELARQMCKSGCSLEDILKQLGEKT